MVSERAVAQTAYAVFCLEEGVSGGSIAVRFHCERSRAKPPGNHLEYLKRSPSHSSTERLLEGSEMEHQRSEGIPPGSNGGSSFTMSSSLSLLFTVFLTSLPFHFIHRHGEACGNVQGGECFTGWDFKDFITFCFCEASQSVLFPKNKAHRPF